MSQHGGSRKVQAVQTTCDIINELRETGGAGVTELADKLGISKGAVHSHLATLMDNEYVVKDGDTYMLSLRYLDLAETVKDRLGMYDVVVEELEELAVASDELAQFATEEHGRAVYLYKAEGKKAVQTASSVGKREYLHCLALGKAILAHLPRERVEQIVDEHGLPRQTANTITDRDELFEELATIRERGYAIDDEEKIKGLRCVAAPVKDIDEEVLGAVSISGPASRMQGEQFDTEIPEMVNRSTNVIEINAKFS